MAARPKKTCADYTTEQSLFEALQRHVRQAQDCLYENGLALMLSNLKQKGGKEDDIRDAFQEGILDFSMKVNDLELRGKVTTILYAFVRNKWVDILRKQGIAPKEEKLKPLEDDESNSIYWIERVHESESKSLQKKVVPFPKNFDTPSQSPDPLEQLLDSDLQQAIRSEIKKMPPIDQEVARLTWFEWLDAQEIAQLLNLKIGTVYNKRSAIRERLKALINR